MGGLFSAFFEDDNLVALPCVLRAKRLLRLDCVRLSYLCWGFLLLNVPLLINQDE